MNIEIVLKTQPESKIKKFEDKLTAKDYELINIANDTTIIGPNKNQIRAIFKKNTTHMTDGKMRIFTDNPVILKTVKDTLEIFSIHNAK